jgi:hypothetical protein
MEIVQNKADIGITVVVDEKHFVKCKFKDCTLIYSGGDYAWTETTFENCRVTLSGSAQRVANFLGTMGVLKPGNQMVPVVQNQKPGIH